MVSGFSIDYGTDLGDSQDDADGAYVACDVLGVGESTYLNVQLPVRVSRGGTA